MDLNFSFQLIIEVALSCTFAKLKGLPPFRNMCAIRLYAPGIVGTHPFCGVNMGKYG